MTGRLGGSTPSAPPRRRVLVGLLAGAMTVYFVGSAVRRDAVAQIVDWSQDDAARYAAVRRAFPEYDDLPDRDFSARMTALFQTLDENPNADVVVAEVSRRMPEYRDAPRGRIQREMISLFRKARQHFAAP